MKKTKKILLSACVATAMIPSLMYPVSINAQEVSDSENQIIDWESATTKKVTITYFDVTTNQTVATANQDVIVWKGVAYIPTAWLDVPEGYEFAKDYGALYEIGWGYDTVSVQVKPVEEVNMLQATLNVNFVDENGVTIDYAQTFNSIEGKEGEYFTFIPGENYYITLPEGYTFEGEYPQVQVAFGQQQTIVLNVKSIKQLPDDEDKPDSGDEEKPATDSQEDPSVKEEDKSADTKEDSKKSESVDTAVAMPLAEAFGTMSVALAGMITLLRRKQK